MEPDKIGLALADASDIHGQSEASASGGQTEAPEATAKTDCHFICFVAAEGEVYELDGNKSFPINHGEPFRNVHKCTLPHCHTDAHSHNHHEC